MELNQASRTNASRLVLICLFILSSCSEFTVKPVVKASSFLLNNDYQHNEKIILRAGEYHAKYEDEHGTYYESPFTLDEQYYFNRSRRGGVFISPDGYQLYYIGRHFGGGFYGSGSNLGDFVFTKTLDERFRDEIYFVGSN